MSEREANVGGWIEVTHKRGFNFIPAKKPMTAVKFPHGYRGRVNAEAYAAAIGSGRAVAIDDPSTKAAADSVKKG
jgi:hypothetical protein